MNIVLVFTNDSWHSLCTYLLFTVLSTLFLEHLRGCIILTFNNTWFYIDFTGKKIEPLRGWWCGWKTMSKDCLSHPLLLKFLPIRSLLSVVMDSFSVPEKVSFSITVSMLHTRAPSFGNMWNFIKKDDLGTDGRLVKGYLNSSWLNGSLSRVLVFSRPREGAQFDYISASWCLFCYYAKERKIGIEH